MITSDSKVTTEVGLSFEMKKIHPILLGDEHVAVAGAAGNTALAKYGFETVQEVLTTYAQKNCPVPHNEFKNAVREIEDKLLTRFSQLRGHGVEPSFQMVLGSLDLEGNASLYEFDSTGLAEPVHDDPTYSIIGKGLVTGGILLLRMIGYDQDLELGLVSAFIIDSVSEVDTAVGPFIGESYLMRLGVENERRKVLLGPLTADALREYKEQIRARRSLIRKLWRSCDKYGEDKMAKVLDRVEKSE
jgi:hypothetical protein